MCNVVRVLLLLFQYCVVNIQCLLFRFLKCILFRKEVKINSTGGKAFEILQITIICRPPSNTDTITLGCRYWKYSVYTLCFQCVLVQTGKSVDWVSQ